MRLVVGHVARSGAELGVGFDDFVDGFEEIFLCGDFPASSDGEHSRLRAHAPDLRSCKNIQREFSLGFEKKKKVEVQVRVER